MRKKYNMSVAMMISTFLISCLFHMKNPNKYDANRLIEKTAYYTFSYSKVDAISASVDIASLSGGTHQLIAKSGKESKTVTLQTENSKPAAEPGIQNAVDLDLLMETIGYPGKAIVNVNEKTKSNQIYEAKKITDIKSYEGIGDSTAAAVKKKNSSAATVSKNGEYPYQIFEIRTDGSETDKLRFDVTAGTDYNREIQLYALNTVNGSWEILETTVKGDMITAVFPLKNRLKGGKVSVLVQARGKEYTPYTNKDTKMAQVGRYSWNGKSVPKQYDFSFAWITDTQYYSKRYLQNFNMMTEWIVKNRKKYNIEYLFHTGDITNDFNEEYQFINASNQFRKLEKAGIPYGVLAGNHDASHKNKQYDLYYKYFGEHRYKKKIFYGGSYKNNLGHYDLITVDGAELLIISMSWDMNTPETDWINGVLEKYPDRKAIICTHGGINANAEQRYRSNLLIQNVCKKNSNVVAILSGHYHGSALNVVGLDDNADGVNDRAVYQICTDYQSAPGGGSGYIKMLYFDLANSKLYINSYSPVLNDTNYYDTPKLNRYGIGTKAHKIDIAELSVDWNRKAIKTLRVTGVTASLLTNLICSIPSNEASSANEKTEI